MMTSPLAVQLLQSFHLLTNSARVHQDNNKVLVDAVERFRQVIGELCLEDDEVTLLFSEGSFYLREEKIRLDRSGASFGDVMLRYFDNRQLEGLRFHEVIRQTPLAAITAWFRTLNDSVRQQDPPSWLDQQIEEAGLDWVEVVRVSQVSQAREKKKKPGGKKKGGKGTGKGSAGQGGGEGGEGSAESRQKKRKSAIQTYGYAVMSLQDVAQKISANKRPSIKKTMRLVQNMVDMVVDDSQMFLSLSTIRDYDDYTYTHSINVSILSICLGHRIGLSKSSLENLSLSALFHDLGKIDVPKEILNKPGRLDDREMQIMRRHSIDSVRRIIKLKTTRKKKAPLLLPPFEHHLKYDLSGYPKTPRKKPISLFGRIIAIADVFDALTAPRIYRPSAWTPDKALGLMLQNSGKDFDPVLLKIFINMIGIYPIGTLLKLDDEEIGLVAGYTDDAKARELLVQLLVRENGSFRKGELVNLGPWNDKTSSFSRPIRESLHPSEYGIQPAEFIM